jgi:Tetratricopeptide repeat
VTEAFAEANRLWFRTGRTARALSRYAEAAAAAPEDPVMALQLSRALWAVDRFAEARKALTVAEAHRDGLSDIGQLTLDQWRRLSAHRPDRHHSDLPPDRLDRDRLSDYAGDWRRVAEAADERGMGGLAAYALERWGGVPIDAEDGRDIEKILTNRDLEEALVGQLPSTQEGRS